jgi:hypothetical protein
MNLYERKLPEYYFIKIQNNRDKQCQFEDMPSGNAGHVTI